MKQKARKIRLDNRLLLVLASVALFLVYSGYIFYIHPPWNSVYSDMAGYIERSFSMSRGVTLAPFDSFYPAGMTYLFAPFFLLFSFDTALRAISLFQAVLLVGSVLSTYWLVEFATGKRWAAWVGAGAAAFYFPLVTYTGFFLSELPFTFFLTFGLLLFYRTFFRDEPNWFSAFLVGIVLGVATIIRGTLYPTILLLALSVLLFVPLKKIWKCLLVFLAGVSLLVLLQVSHTYAALGKFELLPTNGGINTYLGQARVRSVANSNGAYGSSIFYNNNSYYDRDLTLDVKLDTAVWDQGAFYKLVVKRWQADPLRQIGVSLRNAVDLFRPVAHWPARNDTRLIPLLHDSQFWFNILVYPLILLGLLAAILKKDRKQLALFSVIGSALIGVIISAMVTKGEERYLVPYYPLLFASAALGISNLKELLKRLSRRRG